MARRVPADVTVTLDGDTLTLDDGTVTLTLVDKEVATPDQPIEGTLWVVDGIITGDAVSSVPEGVTASMRIVDGQAEVHFGLQHGRRPGRGDRGHAHVRAAHQHQDGLRGRPDGRRERGQPVLSGTVGYSIDADVLTLDAGADGLMLRAAP